MNDLRNRFQTYIGELRAIYAGGAATELSGRSVLEALLKSFASDTGRGLEVRHEPKRIGGKGAPDFRIAKAGATLGYVENKAPGAALDSVLKSDQIKRYQSLSGNILITDYLHWVWIGENGVRRAALCDPCDLQDPGLAITEDRAEAVAALIQGFFSAAPEGIGRAQPLALALAVRSRLLRDFLGRELGRQKTEDRQGRLFGLYEAFRDQVFHQLSLEAFADAFAQTLAYGLFFARLNSGTERITLHNAQQFIPKSFSLIRELVDFLDVLENDSYRDIGWVVEEVLSIMNSLDLAAIHNDLAFINRRAGQPIQSKDEEEWRLFSRDPFIYFYEDYLAKYDAGMRKARGVYYTPPPIVNFIVRSLDGILKKTFGIADGLADHRRVTVLDFACGTGTFLIETLERIFETIGGPQSGNPGPVVHEHILKNIYGFEYLIAPYTIAHLKLSQYLKERGHALDERERFQVFLTNTLESIESTGNLLLPALTAETRDAQTVKEKSILVITGNPPYAGHSKNKGTWIAEAIGEYKQVWETGENGQVNKAPLGEKNLKWLQDDYVKFIRFAQMKMDEVGEGIVGIITNHSFLDNPTFRGMRQSLMRSFDRIYVLDLHGNAKKKERAPDGGRDENVFDIQQGVAVSLLIKKSDIKEKGVWHAEFWGRRQDKYRLAVDADFDSVEWKKLDAAGPFHLFVPQDRQRWAEYERGWPVSDIFQVKSVGVVTARDHLAIHFDRETLLKTVRDFARLPVETAREKYNLGKDVQDWKVPWAQADLKDAGPVDKPARPISYRPFDPRWTYYTGKSRGFHCRPRKTVRQHMLQDNVALITSRLTKGEDFAHAVVTDQISDAAFLSPNTSNNGFVFPLYLYSPEPEEKKPMNGHFFEDAETYQSGARSENFKIEFREWVNARYGHVYAAEDILGYLYAVLHAPEYRARYNEFLRIDFPRISFPQAQADFEALSRLGRDLTGKHLMREHPGGDLGRYAGWGDHRVEKPRYVEAEEAVYINQTQHFAPVPAAVWNFRIGGYQVLDKYLKSRKGRPLSLDEIDRAERIVNTLAFTINRMAEIDKAYQTAFS